MPREFLFLTCPFYEEVKFLQKPLSLYLTTSFCGTGAHRHLWVQRRPGREHLAFMVSVGRLAEGDWK